MTAVGVLAAHSLDRYDGLCGCGEPFGSGTYSSAVDAYRAHAAHVLDALTKAGWQITSATDGDES